LAAKAATTTIPVVFLVSNDPINLGLVASIARPEGNVTGINFVSTELAAKRLELLRALVPTAARVAILVNPSSPVTDTTLKELEAAARALALQIQVVRASTVLEIEAAFSAFARERPDALFLAPDPLFTLRRVQLANLASRHAIPMTSITREVTDAGGLMSYGSNIADAYREVGVYAGRILKGAKPADLPVMQASRVELVINNATARMLGLTVPPSLLAIADEVIE
jgi:putative tryptophan/tyrosine transport system substrate-binding protein